MHENRFSAGRYCEVGFLHQNKVYIFGFSIPVGSLSYIDCIDANTVPRWKVAPSFRKFTLTALYGDAWKPVFCRPVLRSGLSAPKQGLHFWVLHSRRFPFIYRLHWCKHGTTVKGSPEFPQIYTDGPIRRCMKTGFLQARTAKWAFCIKTRFTFLCCPFPYVPFHI